MSDAKTVEFDPGILRSVTESMRQHAQNACVGQKLVTENERVRVWMMHLQPGERVSPHRHVLDYFWVALTAGRTRSYRTNGNGVFEDESEVVPGSVAYTRYGPGEFKQHDLENIGTTEVIFTVVEFLDSPNEPLPVPDAVRLNAPSALVRSKPLS